MNVPAAPAALGTVLVAVICAMNAFDVGVGVGAGSGLCVHAIVAVNAGELPTSVTLSGALVGVAGSNASVFGDATGVGTGVGVAVADGEGDGVATFVADR